MIHNVLFGFRMGISRKDVSADLILWPDTNIFSGWFIFVLFSVVVLWNLKINFQCALLVLWHISAVYDLNKTKIQVTWAECPACYQRQQMFDVLESIFQIRSSPHHIISWESMPGQYPSSGVKVHLICLTGNMAFWQELYGFHAECCFARLVLLTSFSI